jgi:excisionase family DNA binding protein
MINLDKTKKQLSFESLRGRPMTKNETKSFLSISMPTLDALIRSKQLSAFKIGKRVFVHPADLDNYLNQKRGILL